MERYNYMHFFQGSSKFEFNRSGNGFLLIRGSSIINHISLRNKLNIYIYNSTSISSNERDTCTNQNSNQTCERFNIKNKILGIRIRVNR